MFSQKMPETIDGSLISETMAQWKSFWMVPAIMAAAIMIVFFLAFWDKIKVESDADSE